MKIGKETHPDFRFKIAKNFGTFINIRIWFKDNVKIKKMSHYVEGMTSILTNS